MTLSIIPFAELTSDIAVILSERCNRSDDFFRHSSRSARDDRYGLRSWRDVFMFIHGILLSLWL
jgi:hypothetical protein